MRKVVLLRRSGERGHAEARPLFDAPERAESRAQVGPEGLLADSFFRLLAEMTAEIELLAVELRRARTEQEWAQAAGAERAWLEALWRLVEEANNLKGVRAWLDAEQEVL